MKIKIYIIFGFLLFIILSCTNPFSTRSPEDPIINSNNQIANLQTDPDSLLSKLRQSFILKDITDYQECISDSFQVGKNFVFIPENREISRMTNWSLQDEKNYFNQLINSGELQNIDIVFYDQLSWNNTPATSVDTMETYFSYQMTFQFRTKTEYFQGRSLIKILRSPASLWYIFYWQDFRINPNDQHDTWSTLKANYRY
jgi:hypothetical protein